MGCDTARYVVGGGDVMRMWHSKWWDVESGGILMCDVM